MKIQWSLPHKNPHGKNHTAKNKIAANSRNMSTGRTSMQTHTYTLGKGNAGTNRAKKEKALPEATIDKTRGQGKEVLFRVSRAMKIKTLNRINIINHAIRTILLTEDPIIITVNFKMEVRISFITTSMISIHPTPPLNRNHTEITSRKILVIVTII